MEAKFWLQRWENNQVGFHEDEVNPYLIQYCHMLSLAQESRVFIPLCGKTNDIAWLLAQGYRVVGVELAQTAIEQLFVALGVEPSKTEIGQIKRYSAKNIDIFVGDIFAVNRELLGSVDAVYDRAALVALPAEMRRRYSAHLTEIVANKPQLLITFEYDQALMEGPPFSVSHDEVKQQYGRHYGLTCLYNGELVGGLKGVCAAIETVWLLSRGE